MVAGWQHWILRRPLQGLLIGLLVTQSSAMPVSARPTVPEELPPVSATIDLPVDTADQPINPYQGGIPIPYTTPDRLIPASPFLPPTDPSEIEASITTPEHAQSVQPQQVGLTPTHATIWSWGVQTNGSLGTGVAGGSQISRPVTITLPVKVASLDSGEYHTILVGDDGQVRAWGANGSGQLGDGTTTNRTTPITLTTITGVAKANAGSSHTLAIRTDGTVWAWGEGANGRLGNGTDVNQSSPVSVTTAVNVPLSNTVAVAGGTNHSLALDTQSRVWAWGDNQYGQLGDGEFENQSYAVQVKTSYTTFLTEIASIASVKSDAQSNHVEVIARDGTVWGWGVNWGGQLGDGTFNTTGFPSKAVSPGTGSGYLTGVQFLATGTDFTVAATNPAVPSATLWSWGVQAYGALGTGVGDGSYISRPVTVSIPSRVIAMDSGQYHTLIAGEDGLVRAWGRNDQGQIGDGTTVDKATPTLVSGISSVCRVDAGSSHSLAVRQDGSVWAWGDGQNGRLGTGTEDSKTTPVSVTLASGAQFGNVTQVAAGTTHNLALDASRQVWTWGDNSSGQLGQGVTGSQYDQYHPVKVLGPGGVSVLSNTVSIATGYQTSYAVQGDGTLWAWGTNGDGQLGDGSTTLRNLPVQVMVSSTIPLTNVVSVVGGGTFAVALQADGTVWAWGDNQYGQLGQGNTTDQLYAVRVRASVSQYLKDIVSIAIIKTDSQANHILALAKDTTVYGWGVNWGGQLGNGNTDTSTYPTKVVVPDSGSTPISNIHFIAVGRDFSLAASNPMQTIINSGGQEGYSQATEEELFPGVEDNMPLIGGTQGPGGAHTRTGAVLLSETDIAIAGNGPSPAFIRTFNSNDGRIGPLGPGWTHNYAMRIRFVKDGNGDLLLTGPLGRADYYTKQIDGSYLPPAGVFSTLTAIPLNGYLVTTKDQGVREFDAFGRLIRITDRYGNTARLIYNSVGQLASVVDPAGRGSLTFFYDGDGFLDEVKDWYSPQRSVSFSYETFTYSRTFTQSTKLLNSVTDREGKTTTYTWSQTNPNDPNYKRLTQITDANGNHPATYSYNEAINIRRGAINTFTDAVGNQTSYGYSTGYGLITQTTSITMPATSYETGFNPTTTDTFTATGAITGTRSRLVLKDRSMKPTSTSAEDVSESYQYDGYANVIAATDPRGATTTFCYDVEFNGITGPATGSRGNLTRIIEPRPNGTDAQLVTLFVYDAKNNTTKMVPPKGVRNTSGDTITCSTGILTGQVNPLDNSFDQVYATDFTYDAAGCQ